jgi:hypothetical protein
VWSPETGWDKHPGWTPRGLCAQTVHARPQLPQYALSRYGELRLAPISPM